jgi:hypothetical protein
MSYKEKKQPVERNVVRHGKHKKGLIDMSFYPSKVSVPGGGEVKVEELLKEIGQKRIPQHKNRHYKKEL